MCVCGHPRHSSIPYFFSPVFLFPPLFFFSLTYSSIFRMLSSSLQQQVCSLVCLSVHSGYLFACLSIFLHILLSDYSATHVLFFQTFLSTVNSFFSSVSPFFLCFSLLLTFRPPFSVTSRVPSNSNLFTLSVVFETFFFSGWRRWREGKGRGEERGALNLLYHLVCTEEDLAFRWSVVLRPYPSAEQSPFTGNGQLISIPACDHVRQVIKYT